MGREIEEIVEMLIIMTGIFIENEIEEGRESWGFW